MMIMTFHHATLNSKKIYFFQKWSNLNERSGIGWIERKTKFQIFFRFLFFKLCRKTLKQAILWMKLSPTLFRLESSIKKYVRSRGTTKTIFFLHFFSIFQFFFFNFSNLLGTSGIDWIEKKTEFEIFLIFFFHFWSISCHFVTSSP